ncbi:glycosyltransferase family protein [Corynebacterium guangdongense]|uniref:Glycosyltransferase n=1 Tax=Corynebacterium guangdongense TaxID=1783348 RepID=A0ABU1ZZS8_9CORY|nr:glycosyltransferase [Corynebacterium guangdongense]MDR7329893.1 hypothetical protein [Corynebacterium guangdongense]
MTPDGWKSELASGVDLLFVESAWAGNDGAWQYQLTGTRAPSQPLQDLLQHCRRLQIPTVFWNKEDPPHFDDFLATAKLFDTIFTTDSNKIDAYQREVGHNRIFALPFAAQPRLHNPARNGIQYAKHDVAFAGTYFRHKFRERRDQMDLILGAASDVGDTHGIGFTIFSRHAGKDEKYQFPAPFDRWVVGALPYSQMLAAYRGFKVFLNVNSVVDSPSMCARRIFEISASGTPVLSTPSAAITEFFPEDEVPVVHSREHARRMIRALVLSPELRERIAHRAQRRIWENHTYHHRALTIADKVGFDVEVDEPVEVSIICSTNRDASLGHLLDQVAHQIYPNVELVALGHGIDFDDSLRDRARDLGIRLTLLSAPAEISLGTCLNQLVNASNGQIIAKFDDDDYYRPNYLRDQVSALRWSGADLVGKASIYLHLAGDDLLVRRWHSKEHKWSNFVAGATLVGWKRTFLDTRFQELGVGEDSQFLKDLEDQGKYVYSADRFNYMATRNRAGTHTWNISDAEILSYSTVESIGLNLSHITV